ncbi:helix-turn-helix domain-containing protein [Paenibacillaceae bacterium WGS1546]|uniref:helix-turn-helix domain-containing protein n=1 Tax=Cohnella sp. WGS1546 TaxID=3366810 RepID=UPI00372D85F3
MYDWFKSYEGRFSTMVSIAELRARNGKMTQKELADSIGTTQTTISAWEKDITVISAPHLIRLCKFFKVSSDSLLGIDGEDKKIYL